MPFNITVDHISTAHNSDHSHSGSSRSYTDEEDSSGTGVHLPSPRSAVGSHGYSEPSDPVEEGSWNHIYPDEIGPSESASRPRTSNQHRPAAPEAPPPNPVRRQSSRREAPRERLAHRPHPRARAPPPPSDPESVESYDEWPPTGYVRAPHPPPPMPGRASYGHWAPAPGNPLPAYAHSYSSAPGYAQYPQAGGVPAAGQLVPFQSPGAYPMSPYQQHGGGVPHGYFPPAPHVNHMAHPASPYSGQELMHHHSSPGYFPYPQSHPMPVPTPVYVPVPYSPPPPPPPQAPAPAATPAPAPASTPAPPQPTPPPAPPPETPKDDERFARLEQLMIDERTDREAREAAAKKAVEDAAAKAEADKQRAEEIATASGAAAAAAKKEAEDKAAEDAAKAKEEAEAAKAQAVADATPSAPPPPEERKKPIKFKDAVGRKFSFPYHLCNTWMGMEDLIRQAFLHVEIIGPHVAEGHYDLVGPTGDIILPQVWETVVEPDWTITMHMWPIPEPPPPEEMPPADEVIMVPDAPPPGQGKKKKKPSGGFSSWMMGPKPKPKPKSTKKTG